MRAEDVSAAVYVKKAALQELLHQTGQQMPAWQPSPPTVLTHLLRTDPQTSWVAEINGVLVGFAQALVRGDIWYLSQLFVQPEVHAHGAGQKLLDCVMSEGRRLGARKFAVASSISFVAQALYMRAGMLATGIGYRLSGDVEVLRRLPDPAANRKRIVDCAGWLDRIGELDRELFGAERRQDHEFYLSNTSMPGEEASFGLNDERGLVGYGYVESEGWIGPLAAREPEDQLPLLRMAGDWLAERGAQTAEMWVLTLNRTIMDLLMAGGWKIRSRTYFLTSEPFGQFDRYQPSGGALL